VAGKPRKRYGKPLDLLQLQTLVSQALRYLAETIDNAELAQELRLRACSAMAANAGVYRQLLETSDLDTKLQAMSERLAAMEAHAVENNHHGPRA
jgi:hypothetical protein